MAAAFLSRVKNFRASGNSLQVDLKKITDSGCMDIPSELLDTIVQASHDHDNRRQIMTHVRECLAGPTPAKQWRRVYSALVLTDDLMQRADRLLLVETAEGYHFDVIQRLSFLEHFDNPDKRAQGLVRSKASTLRLELVPKLQNASAEGAEGVNKDLEDVHSQGEASTCSPSVTSHHTLSTDASNEVDKPSSFSPAIQATKPTGRMILNGIVSVGHSDDTTDESSGDEANPVPVQYRQAKPWKQANLHEEATRADQQMVQTSAQSVDLLDL